MIIKPNKTLSLFVAMLSVAIVISLIPQQSDARGNRGGGGGRTHTSVNRGGSVNRNRSSSRNTNISSRNTNVNVNKNVNVDVDVNNRHGGCCYGGGYHHPIATGVAIGATAAITAAVIGSVIYTLPPQCTTVITSGISYRHCGSTWYEPQYSGNNVSYVVITAP